MTQEWILCPVCGGKTRDRLREDKIILFTVRSVSRKL